MSEPRDFETRSTNEILSTEQIANAGEAGPTTAAEPRSFKGDDEFVQADDDTAHPIFPEHEASDLRRSWESIQAGFVDEPRASVEEADHLVAATMKRLAEMFAEERSRLESQWDRGDDVSTEDLRLALQRYRTFFGRLLAI